MPDDKIVQLIRKDQFEQEQKLFGDILEVIDDYQGKLSVVSVLGILNLAQDEVKAQSRKE